MDDIEEIKNISARLLDINQKIRIEQGKIASILIKIKESYRRRDREKYEAERRAIMGNLKKYEAEMEEVRKKLSELESVGVPM